MGLHTKSGIKLPVFSWLCLLAVSSCGRYFITLTCFSVVTEVEGKLLITTNT